MLIRSVVTGLVVGMAGSLGLIPDIGFGQVSPVGRSHYRCADQRPCTEISPRLPGQHPPQWIPPESRKPEPTPDKPMPDEPMPEEPTPEDPTPETPMPETTPEQPSPITPPDASAADPSLSFAAPEAGLGTADVAFGGVPGMIGDQFGQGSGQFGLPLIIGRAILHADSVNGMPTLVGANDFHLIDESLDPAGFQGGGGTSSQFFVAPNSVFNRQQNGDPIPPGSVSGLQTFDPTLFGFPEDSEGLIFTATQTPDQASVQDQTSSDRFPNTPVYVITVGDGQTPLVVIPTASPSSGGVVVGRQKTAENTSPIPRDRIFLNYNYFNNTPLFPGGVDVNRFSPGFEKTFFDGNASLEMRFPFATTLDSDIVFGGATDTSNVEFGNIYLALKALLYQTDTYTVSGGLAMGLPTGDDTRVSTATGTPLVRVNNESVHLLPFLGALYVPNDRFFAQGFLQFDFDANGNPVDLNLFGNRLTEAGVANDATYMYVDAGIGYWLYRNQTGSSWLTGLAPTVELHYNRSLQEGDVIERGFYQVGSFEDEVQNLNALVGGTAVLGQNTTLTAAYVTPIGNSADQFFDGEARVSLNWYFGPSAQGMNPFPAFSGPSVR